MPPIPPPPPPPQVAQSGAGNNSSTRNRAVRREISFLISFTFVARRCRADSTAPRTGGSAVFCLGWMRVRGEGAVWLRIVQQESTGIQRRPVPAQEYSTNAAFAPTGNDWLQDFLTEAREYQFDAKKSR